MEICSGVGAGLHCKPTLQPHIALDCKSAASKNSCTLSKNNFAKPIPLLVQTNENWSGLVSGIH